MPAATRMILEAAGRYGPVVDHGRLVTIEGIDGAGKSTLAASLADALAEFRGDVVLLREPGGVELSERIRTLVKDPGIEVGAAAEALLYAAARAQLVEQLLRPLLDRGTLVLLDRFIDSSLAYQGAGRGLGIDAVRDVNLMATRGLVPDRTLLLRIAGADARARQAGRALAPDRLESEGEDFFVAVAAAYDELAAQEPARIRVIDASQDPADVLRCAIAETRDLLRDQAR
jgi:dTMP kinase